jgi:hypothetical protein
MSIATDQDVRYANSYKLKNIGITLNRSRTGSDTADTILK